MKEITYPELMELVESIPVELQERIGSLPTPGANRYVLDDDELVFGYRAPAMFQKGVPIKWEAEVISLETGGAIPGLALMKQKPAKREAASDAAPAPAALFLRHSDILASPLNPRTRFNAETLAELKVSLRTHGFRAEMSRLWVRPHPTEAGKYELIGGERRWRVSGELIAEGVMEDRLPVAISEMADADLLELALVDGIDRDDLSPLDEAEGVCRLLDLRDEQGEPKYTVASLALRLGRGTTHISRCRTLRRLRGTPVGEAIESGQLTASHGELLARIAAPTVRAAMLQRVLHPSDGHVVAKRTLESWIRDEVQVELRGANFDQADPELVPVQRDEHGERIAGGACLDCPHNTRNNPEVSAKIHACMNIECFQAKRAAVHRRWQESVEAPGVQALPPEAQKQVFADDGVSLRPNCGMIEIENEPEEWELKKGCEKAAAPWSKLTRGRDLPEQWIMDGKGKVRKLAAREMAIAAAIENKHDIFRRAAPAEAPRAQTDRVEREAAAVQMDRQWAEARELEEARREEAGTQWQAQVGAIVNALEASYELPENFWPVMWWLLNGYFPEGIDVSAHRRGMEPGEYDDHARGLTGTRGAGAFVEMVIQQTWADAGADEGSLAMKQFAELLKVDLKAVAKEALRTLKEKRKASAEPEPVRKMILKLAGKRGIDVERLNIIASQVLGKPSADRPWEAARGEELTAILEEVKAAPTTPKNRVRPTVPEAACQPNQHGVYEEDGAEMVPFGVKGVNAGIRVLEVRPGVWIEAVEVMLPGGCGFSQPLTEQTVFATRDEALKRGLCKMEEWLADAPPDSKVQERAVAALRAMLEARRAGMPDPESEVPDGRKKGKKSQKSKMSGATRAKMAAAAQERWAAQQKGVGK